MEKKEVLENVFGDMLVAIDEGQSKFVFGDVDITENYIVIQSGDKTFRLFVELVGEETTSRET